MMARRPSDATPLDHDGFGRLRLTQFLPKLRVIPPSRRYPGSGRRFRGDVIVQVANWEFDERSWVGEVIGFTEFLRPTREVEVTRSIAVELEGKRAAVGEAVLAAIGLPLSRCLDRKQIERRLGKPKRVEAFVPEQETLEFRVGSRARAYRVECTVTKARGLTYVVVRRSGR